MQRDKNQWISRVFHSREGIRITGIIRCYFHDGIPTKFLFLRFVLIFLLLSTTSVYAANVYVRPGATGANNGSDWTNSYTNLPSTLVRGNTYYLAGGSYGSRNFNTSTSATTMIYIKKATVSDHGTETGWNSSYATTQATFTNWTFSTGYYEIDGVAGGGPGSWESGHGIKVTNGYHAVDIAANINTITFKHVELVGGGAAAPRSGGGGGQDCDLIYALNGRVTNFTMQYCLLRDANRTMMLTWPSPFNTVLIEYTKFARNGAEEHAEAWSAGNDSNVILRYNLWEDMNATGFICIVNGGGDATNWQIYGNVFRHTVSSMFINTGAIFVRYEAGINIRAVNWKVHNNVFAGLRGWLAYGIVGYQNSTGCETYNNVLINNRSDSLGLSGTAGYTWYYNNYGYTNSGQDKSPATSGTNVKGTSDPFTNSAAGDFTPRVAIPGLALLAPYNVDPLGNIRGADGVWDRGAYEYVSGGGGKIPASPTGIVVN